VLQNALTRPMVPIDWPEKADLVETVAPPAAADDDHGEVLRH